MSWHCCSSTLWLVSTVGPGGTQLWVGYRCAARSFDHHPITKPEKTQICNLYLNHLFLEGPFLKPNSTLYHVHWTHKYFLTTYRWTKGKIHWKLCILQKCDPYLNHFQIKRGSLVNLRGRKSTLSGPHIPVPTFPLSTPPPPRWL